MHLKAWMSCISKLFISSCIFLSLVTLSHSESISGRADIIDGDTLNILGIPLRLAGIDAPEGLQSCKDQTGTPWDCGKAATRALAGKTGSKTVTCEIEEKDQFGRHLAECFIDGESLNVWMVREGWALAFLKYSDKYLPDQAAAEAAKAGVWRGSFDLPWEWRANVAQTAIGQSQDGECVIKGNISRVGERIYHMPFQQFYNRTRINEAKGERWFCTEGEAQNAGWRRSLR